MSDYVLDAYGLPRRVLAWIDSGSDRIGARRYERNTAVGLSAHLTNDPNSFDGPLEDVSVERTVAVLADLVAADLVTFADGVYARTPAGDRALGGVVYADLPAESS